MECTRYRFAKVTLLSQEEWEGLGLKSRAVFLPLSGTILIRYQDTYEEIYGAGAWEEALTHEYVHYLQYLNCEYFGDGTSKTKVKALGLNCPITLKIKRLYKPEHWVIESEAFYIQKRPWLLESSENSIFKAYEMKYC